jgi:hypothetical protein
VANILTSSSRKEFSFSGDIGSFWRSANLIKYQFSGTTYREELRFLLNEERVSCAPHYWTSMVLLTASLRGLIDRNMIRLIIDKKITATTTKTDIVIKRCGLDPLNMSDEKSLLISPFPEWKDANSLNSQEYINFFNETILRSKGVNTKTDDGGNE